MTSPQWEPTDQHDLLSVLADPHPIVGADIPSRFLAACKRDAMDHYGLVSVNRVRSLLAGQDIPPRQLSAMWSHFTGQGRPMRKVPGKWELCAGSTSKNNGRPYPIREWLGTQS